MKKALPRSAFLFLAGMPVSQLASAGSPAHHPALIVSIPPMYGRSTSGMVIEPSACW